MKKSDNIFTLNTFFYWSLTICYMAVLYYSSSISGTRLPGLPNAYDKLIHFLVYTILAFLIYCSLARSGIRRYLLILSFLFAVIYGITDEIHQLYVPFRDASIGDVIANSLGALCGSYLASKLISSGISGRNSVGRVRASQALGRGFESRRPLQ